MSAHSDIENLNLGKFWELFVVDLFRGGNLNATRIIQTAECLLIKQLRIFILHISLDYKLEKVISWTRSDLWSSLLNLTAYQLVCMVY